MLQLFDFPLPSNSSLRQAKSLSLDTFNEILSHRASFFDRYLVFLKTCDRIRAGRLSQPKTIINNLTHSKRCGRVFKEGLNLSAILDHYGRSIVTTSICFDGTLQDEGWIPIAWDRECHTQDFSDMSDGSEAEEIWETGLYPDKEIWTPPSTPASPSFSHRTADYKGNSSQQISVEENIGIRI